MGVEQTINCAQTGSKDALRRQGFFPHNNNHNLAGAKLGFSSWKQIILRIIKFQPSGKFPLGSMRVLAPGSAHARSSARPPIDTSGNFPAQVSAESPSNISPPSTIFEFLSHLLYHSEGGRGSVTLFFIGMLITKWHIGACKISMLFRHRLPSATWTNLAGIKRIWALSAVTQISGSGPTGYRTGPRLLNNFGPVPDQRL